MKTSAKQADKIKAPVDKSQAKEYRPKDESADTSRAKLIAKGVKRKSKVI